MTITTTHLANLTQHAAQAPLPIAARLAVSFAVAMTTWGQRARTRRALSELSECHLRDIGLTVAEAREEARKRMWQL